MGGGYEIFPVEDMIRALVWSKCEEVRTRRGNRSKSPPNPG